MSPKQLTFFIAALIGGLSGGLAGLIGENFFKGIFSGILSGIFVSFLFSRAPNSFNDSSNNLGFDLAVFSPAGFLGGVVGTVVTNAGWISGFIAPAIGWVLGLVLPAIFIYNMSESSRSKQSGSFEFENDLSNNKNQSIHKYQSNDYHEKNNDYGSSQLKPQIKKTLITAEDTSLFGEDFIDMARRVAKESRFIDDSYLFNELTSSYILQDDIDTFGGDLIYIARRVMEDTKRRSEITNSTRKSFVKPNLDDDEIWGSDLIDIFYKVAQEEFNLEFDIARHPLMFKYLAKKCSFCGGSIIKLTRTCESCKVGFPLEALNRD